VFQLLLGLYCWLLYNQTTLHNINPNTIRQINFVQIIQRSERNAKTERLFADHPIYQQIEKKQKLSTFNEQIADQIEQKRNNYLLKNHPNKFKIHKIIYYFQWHELYRPREYTTTKTKIFLHHSALPTQDIKTPKQLQKHLLYIQELHSFFRERGDIGYHFFVAPDGKIYEGRSGGPNVIAAHAQFNNHDSIGINLLGNFNEQELTDEQFIALLSLLIGLINKYNIDPSIEVIHHKKIETEPYIEDINGSPIAYHQLVSNTDCPGKNIIKHIPFIQTFLETFIQYFGPQDNHTKIIQDIFPKINFYLQKEQFSNHLKKLFAQYQKPPSTQKEFTDYPGRFHHFIVLEGRFTDLLLPKDRNQYEQIINLELNIFFQLAQSHASHDQREYFTNQFHQRLILRQQSQNYHTKSSNKSSDIIQQLTIQTKSLLQIISHIP